MDKDKLMQLVGRAEGDLGSTMAAGGIVVGHRPVLYRTLAEGPADRRPWLAHRHRPPPLTSGAATGRRRCCWPGRSRRPC